MFIPTSPRPRMKQIKAVVDAILAEEEARQALERAASPAERAAKKAALDRATAAYLRAFAKTTSEERAEIMRLCGYTGPKR